VHPGRGHAPAEYHKASAIVVLVESGPAEVDPLPVLTLISAIGAPITATRLDWVGSARPGRAAVRGGDAVRVTEPARTTAHASLWGAGRVV
jgi:hypothetical protein